MDAHLNSLFSHLSTIPGQNSLLAMNEFRREQILEERAADRQRVQNARMLADLVKSQQRGGAAGAEDSVSRAAKRTLHRLFVIGWCSLIILAYRLTHSRVD